MRHHVRAVGVVQVKLGLVLEGLRQDLFFQNRKYQQIVNFWVYCNNSKPAGEWHK